MTTTNPVPSNDPTDLLFNAQKLDEVVSGTSQYYTDRLGASRRTVAGINAAADVVLGGLGYAPPVAYASGISLTLTTQTVEYSGEVYAPKLSNLPFTTSTWATDSAKFRLIQGVAATDLASSGGAAMVGYMPAGTGAIATTVQAKIRGTVSRSDYDTDANYNLARNSLANRTDQVVRVEGGTADRLLSAKLADDAVSVFDFMTLAQIADVKANNAASNLAAALDVTAAIQAAINHAATRSLVGGTVYLPPGSYKVTSTIYTYGAGATGQVALVGSGLYSTRFFPSGDFTVLNLVTSYMESGGFSIEWPVTAAASIPSTRIGVELAGADWQFSYATLKNVTVGYGYRGFVLNDWTGQTFGTAYLCTLQQLTAFRCADWGFYLNSKSGSTTLRMIHCYVRGDTSAGGGVQYGKGVYAINFNDIYTEQLAIDQCLNSWINFVNYNVAVLNGIALEGNKMSSASAVAVNFNGGQTVVNGFKDIICTYNTGGNAQVIYCNADCTLSLSGYNEQYSTVVAGTTKYRIAFNASTTDVTIVDSTVLPSHVLDNGWYHSVVYQGIRTSRAGSAPSYGTWLRGDYIRNGSPAVGQPKGWTCTVAGTPGTWVSEGNL